MFKRLLISSFRQASDKRFSEAYYFILNSVHCLLLTYAQKRVLDQWSLVWKEGNIEAQNGMFLTTTYQ